MIVVQAFPAERAGATMRAMLSGAIDYAGLFPPAALSMETAVSHYAAYLASADAWALGRFVVPASRLDALAEAAAPHWNEARRAGALPWRISALISLDAAADAAQIARFNAAHEGVAAVDCAEAAAGDAPRIRQLAALLSPLALFVELPIGAALGDLLPVIGEVGACAKIRTGGVVAEAIPSARDVARFLRACADAGVPFKATAGLHHPLRGEYALTYAPDSDRGTMFGYCNVFAAAQRAREGALMDELVAVLEARSLAALDALMGDRTAVDGASDERSAETMTETRATFARSFGSCSFREPLDDLAFLLQH